MSQQTTIRKLAELVNTPVEKLLEQLAEAGMSFSGPDQVVTSMEKVKLLGFLKRSHGKTDAAADEVIAPGKITLNRSRKQEITVGGSGKAGRGGAASTIDVVVRKKVTLSKSEATTRATTAAEEQDAERAEILRKLEESRLRNLTEQQRLAEGELHSLDNQIDVTTGTLKFKALFENRDQVLFPNQFVSVRLLADTLKDVVLAPSAAIQFGTDGSFVYALEGDDKVKIRHIKVGATDGDVSVIEEGLAAGDRVVLEGTDRLRDGGAVEVVNDSAQVPATPASHLQGGADADAGTAQAADTAKTKAHE